MKCQLLDQQIEVHLEEELQHQQLMPLSNHHQRIRHHRKRNLHFANLSWLGMSRGDWRRTSGIVML